MLLLVLLLSIDGGSSGSDVTAVAEDGALSKSASNSFLKGVTAQATPTPPPSPPVWRCSCSTTRGEQERRAATKKPKWGKN